MLGRKNFVGKEGSAVDLHQNITQKTQQKQVLNLSAEMRQALEVLRMPLPKLQEYIDAEISENPLFDLDSLHPQAADSEFAPVELPTDDGPEPAFLDEGEEAALLRAAGRENSIWSQPAPGTGGEADIPDKGQDFTGMLREQLALLPLAPPVRALAEYIIHCLNERGYLEFEPAELAEELGEPLFDVMQALYAVQSLHPAGVGARSLEECLILQLQESRDFNPHTIRLIKEGLPLLSRGDTEGIMALLGAARPEAEAACRAIRALNPIPSRGYDTGSDSRAVIPDAVVRREADGYHVAMNDWAIPTLVLNPAYTGALAQRADEDTKGYLAQKQSAARALIQAVSERKSTLMRIILCIVELQPDFFRTGEGLTPMTLADVADRLGLHTSTVSRAVQEKYILCAAGTVCLRDLFVRGLPVQASGRVSAAFIRDKIQRSIAAEDPARPLSDEDIRMALQEMQLDVARRTVAKYRAELGIPSAAQRRRGGKRQ